MRNRRRLMLEEETPDNFWPSFTDLTSTITMILFVLVILAYIQNLLNSKNLASAKAELENSFLRLRNSQAQIKNAQATLRSLSAEIESGRDRLHSSETRVQQQQQVIAESNRELAEVRSQLHGIAVLRVDMLKKVKESIEQGLGKDKVPRASIADNGNIILDESLLFESDSYTIKKEGKPFLDSLAGAFLKVLEDDRVRSNIDVILVQGHTDEKGTVSYNRELSARRANAVLDYLFETRPNLGKEYGRYFASSAYSEFRPINTGKNEAAYRENRRIELSVVLRDSGVREVIDEYMQNIDEALRVPNETP